MDALDVVPLTADRWPQLETLFASDSFGGCWCMWPRRPRDEFTPWDPRNREEMHDLTTSGATPGLLCLRNEEPLGWCAVGPCRSFPPYESPPYDLPPDAIAWALPCLYVVSTARGQGVADALVAKAKEYAAQQGATTLHGPPPWWKAREEIEHGSVTRLLLRHGFVRVARGERIPVLCCSLTDVGSVDPRGHPTT